MRTFMDNNFLLKCETAKVLYHNHAKNMSIYDYHCHVNVNEIWEDKKFDNITQVWLYSDHYKWRSMRLFGIEEAYITGDKSDYEKFYAYSKMMPNLIGNPIYHWTHMELKEYFDIDIPLSEKTANEIWDKTKEKFLSGFSVREMIRISNVKKICTTDDPIDTLEYHAKIAKDNSFTVEVLPTFRPDNAIEITKKPFVSWVNSLANVCKQKIEDYSDFLKCLEQRVQYFDANGCVVADHGFDRFVYEKCTIKEANFIFEKGINGIPLIQQEVAKFKTYTLSFLAEQYWKLNWTMQLHIGAMRRNNRIMTEKLGFDMGFDSIDDSEIALPLSRFLDDINNNGLPKTLVYTLNPKDNYVLAAMMGNFTGGSYGTRVHFGCAWWFNDQIDGILEHLKAYANLGVLSKFVGMLTDSRSFLSYVRHDYFRRILCNFLGEKVEAGEYPLDIESLAKIVEDISFNNAIAFISKQD